MIAQLAEIFFNVITPVFALVLIGYLAGPRLGLQARTLSRYAYFILIPCFVFNVIATAEFDLGVAGRMVAFILLVELACAALGFAIAKLLRRTAELGDAWHPFFVPKMVTDTARTANISNDEDFKAALDYLYEHCEKIGRKEKPKIILSGTFSMQGDWSAQEAIDNFSHLRELGADGSGASVVTDNRSEWCDQARRFGEEVIAKLD